MRVSWVLLTLFLFRSSEHKGGIVNSYARVFLNSSTGRGESPGDLCCEVDENQLTNSK